jgi:RNA polymerase sigma-70 factor (ECF subfamily)
LANAARFQEIVANESPVVFRVLARLLGRRDNLEDLAQEVFLRLYRAMDHFRGDSSLSTFLYRITVNVAHDEQTRINQRRQRLTSLDDPESSWHERLSGAAHDPLDTMIRTQFRTIVEECLGLLSERERACLVMFYQEGRSYEAIRQILDIPVGTVKAHLHRGRQRLRAHVQDRLAARDRARKSG